MNHYLEVLNYVYHSHPTTKSNFARYHATLIAEACSRGHITTVICGVAFDRWYVTGDGLKFIEDNYSGEHRE